MRAREPCLDPAEQLGSVGQPGSRSIMPLMFSLLFFALSSVARGGGERVGLTGPVDDLVRPLAADRCGGSATGSGRRDGGTVPAAHTASARRGRAPSRATRAMASCLAEGAAAPTAARAGRVARSVLFHDQLESACAVAAVTGQAASSIAQAAPGAVVTRRVVLDSPQ